MYWGFIALAFGSVFLGVVLFATRPRLRRALRRRVLEAAAPRSVRAALMLAQTSDTFTFDYVPPLTLQVLGPRRCVVVCCPDCVAVSPLVVRWVPGKSLQLWCSDDHSWEEEGELIDLIGQRLFDLCRIDGRDLAPDES